MIVVLLLAFEAVVKYHRIQCKPFTHRPTGSAEVIFPQITHADVDVGVISCLKFFANYGFYRFGREVRRSSLASLGSLLCDCIISQNGAILVVEWAKRSTASGLENVHSVQALVI